MDALPIPMIVAGTTDALGPVRARRTGSPSTLHIPAPWWLEPTGVDMSISVALRVIRCSSCRWPGSRRGRMSGQWGCRQDRGEVFGPGHWSPRPVLDLLWSSATSGPPSRYSSALDRERQCGLYGGCEYQSPHRDVPIPVRRGDEEGRYRDEGACSSRSIGPGFVDEVPSHGRGP